MIVFLLSAFWILAGMTVLIFGGELLVRGASEIAGLARVSPLIIGLTVVAFGTSAPELAVAVQSSFQGQPDLAIGNVVGSNIANVLLILGISAAIAPLTVASRLIRIDVPFMIAASLALLAMGFDGTVSRLDGVILFTALVVYTTWMIRQSRKESADVKAEFAELAAPVTRATVRNLLVPTSLIAVGLVMLGFGSHWLVQGASDIARLLGVSELVIGLTVVAVGTSLPEIVTSVVASLRGQRDIAVGNVVGSNLFNILCVLGLSSIIAEDGVGVSRTALRFDIPVMIAVAAACLPIFFTGHMIARWEGCLFLGYYGIYTTYLIIANTYAGVSRTLEMIMVIFVIPLTVLTITIGVVRTFREDAASRRAE